MRKFKSLLILLTGLLFLVACGGKNPSVQIEVNANLTLQVDQEVKLAINQVTDDLTFEGMDDVISVRTSGEDVFIKGLKTGEVTLKVSYKPNPKITAEVNVKVTPKAISQGYQLNFSVSAPEGFVGDVYAVGEFNEWNIEAPLKLTLADGKYSGTITYETDKTEMEYKYVNHKAWAYVEGDEDGKVIENRKVTLEATTTIEDIILGWEKVYDGTPEPEAKEYTFTFNVLVPEGTEGEVFVVGNFSNWLDEGATPLKLTKGENNYSGSVVYKTNAPISYKYLNAKDLASLNYDFEEVIAENRFLGLEELTANDTISAWKGGGYKEDAVEKEYTLNFNITIPFALEEGYKVWVVGFDGWEEADALELSATELVYSGSKTITTALSQIEYMVVAGKTFSYDHKPLKEDGTEYAYAENITHELVEGANEVNYQVHAWKDLSDTPVEPEMVDVVVRLTEIPDTTETYPIKLIGSMTDWDASLSKVFTKVGDYYEVILNVDKNKTNDFKVYLDKGQENWYDHQASNDGTNELPDHVIKEDEYTQLLVIYPITHWKGLTPPAEPTDYTLSFEVSVPEGTEGEVFVVGDFTNWLEEGSTPLKLTKGEDGKYRGTTTYTTSNASIQYKYVNAKDIDTLLVNEYEFEEVIAANREHTLAEENNIVDTVSEWKDGGYKEAAVEKEYTLNFNITIPFVLEEDYKVWVVGFDGWEEADALELSATELVYSGSKTITTALSQVEYMVLAGKTFGWDHKPLKEDGTEYAYGENITHELVDGANEVNYQVHAWKDLGETPVEPEMVDVIVRLTEIPDTTETYPIKLIGSMTDWDASLSKVFTKVGDYYEVVLNVDKNKTNDFKVYLDKGQENWYDHQASNDGTNELPDHVIKEDEYTQLLVIYPITHWKGLMPPAEPTDYTLSFEVSVPEGTEGEVFVAGNFTNWLEEGSTPLKLTKGEDGKYRGTTTYTTTNSNIQYKYVNAKDLESLTWDFEEVIEANREYTLTEENNIVDTISAWKGGGYKEGAIEKEYTLNFEFTITTYIPEGYKVFLVGEFVGWDASTAIELTGVENVYKHTQTYTTNKTTLEYMLVVGEAFGWDHKVLNQDGESYGAGNIVHTLIDGENNITHPVLGFDGIVEPTPPTEYTLSFEVSVPEGTEGEVFVVGDFTNWLEEGSTPFKLTKGEDGKYRGTTTYTTSNASIQYKYVNAKDVESLTWDYVEVILDNREHELADINNIVDTVSEWKDGGYKEAVVEKEYTLNFNISIPFALEEGYKVWVVGFDGWEEADALELSATELVYSGSKTITTALSQIEYMVVAGKTFSYDHKPLKEDGTEYAYGENITHELVEGVNTINYSVSAWKDLVEPVEPSEYTLSFEVSVPEGTIGEVFVVGDFTNWLEEGSTPLKLTKGEDGKYRGTTTYTTTNLNIQYKYVNAKDVESLNWEYVEVILDNREHELAEENDIVDTVSEWKDGGYKEAPEVDYTLNFSTTVYVGYHGDVYVLGEFNGWQLENALKLTKGEEGKYTGSTTYTTSKATMEYKYFSLDDFEYGESDEEGNYVENRSLILATYEDILNDEIVGFEKLPVYMGTFSVYIYERPSSTGNHPVKLIGSMTNWSSDEALVFTDLGTKLRVSFEIDYNQTHFFKIYLDKGQENWSDHEIADNINTPADNYIITPYMIATTTKEIGFNITYWKGLENVEIEQTQEVLNQISLPSLVTKEEPITLPTTGEHSAVITWNSSNVEVISNDGVVALPNGNIIVSLTATATINYYSKSTVFNVEVLGTTIASLYDVAKDTEIKFAGVITGVSGQNLYIEDNSGAIYIYNPQANTASIGDEVVVNGKKGLFNGLHQVAASASIVILSNDNTISEPTVKSDLSGFVATDQSRRYSIDGLTVASINGQNLTLTDGINNITVRAGSSSGTIYDHINSVVVGQEVNIVGMHLSWFNNPQFAINDLAELEIVELSDEKKVQVAKSDLVTLWENKMFDMDTDVELPTEGLQGTTITWTMDPIDAIVSGKWKTVTENTPVILTAVVTSGSVSENQIINVTIRFVDPNASTEEYTFTLTLAKTGLTSNAYTDISVSETHGTWSGRANKSASGDIGTRATDTVVFTAMEGYYIDSIQVVVGSASTANRTVKVGTTQIVSVVKDETYKDSGLVTLEGFLQSIQLDVSGALYYQSVTVVVKSL